jgi:hypothetical protein
MRGPGRRKCEGERGAGLSARPIDAARAVSIRSGQSGVGTALLQFWPPDGKTKSDRRHATPGGARERVRRAGRVKQGEAGPAVSWDVAAGLTHTATGPFPILA